MTDEKLAEIKARSRKGYPSRHGWSGRLELAKNDVVDLVKAYEELEQVWLFTIGVLAGLDKPAAEKVMRAHAKARAL